MSHPLSPTRSDGAATETGGMADVDRAPAPRDGDPAGVAADDVVVDFAAARDESAMPAQEEDVSTSAAPTAQPPPPADDVVPRERFLRLQADFENLGKRMERERDDLRRHAASGLTARLLPVLDNFERAIAAGHQPGGIGALLEGVELVHRQLIAELRGEGLEEIEALGLIFDPQVHEAVASDASSPLPPNSVIEVMRRGYFFHDRVLRPALVCVSMNAEGAIERDDRRED